jgi:hypothetical protein
MKSKTLAVFGVALVLMVLASGVGSMVQVANAQNYNVVGQASLSTNRRHYHFGDTVYLTIQTSSQLRNARLYIMNPDGSNFWINLGRVSAGRHTMTFYTGPPAGPTTFFLYVSGNVVASVQVYVGW